MDTQHREEDTIKYCLWRAEDGMDETWSAFLATVTSVNHGVCHYFRPSKSLKQVGNSLCLTHLLRLNSDSDRITHWSMFSSDNPFEWCFLVGFFFFLATHPALTGLLLVHRLQLVWAVASMLRSTAMKPHCLSTPTAFAFSCRLPVICYFFPPLKTKPLQMHVHSLASWSCNHCSCKHLAHWWTAWLGWPTLW